MMRNIQKIQHLYSALDFSLFFSPSSRKRTTILILFLLVGLFAHTTVAKTIHVAVDGSSSGDGSLQDPIDFKTACGKGGGENHRLIEPGDTILMHAGTYKGTWWLQLFGEKGAPVVLMPYKNDRVIFDGKNDDTDGGIPTIKFSGQYVHIIGLEFTSSDKRRVSKESGTFVDDMVARQAVFFDAAHSKLINCIIHNNTSGGLLFTERAENSEVYGCIIFNNGWDSPDRGHGHAMYVRNIIGTKTIQDNICFNSMGRGISGYGEIQGFMVKGNTSFHAGMASQHGAERSLFFGGSGASKTIDRLYVEDNVFYHHNGKRVFEVGYVERNRIFVSATKNYVIGGYGLVIKPDFRTLIKENNKESITKNEVIIRPNKYEKGRANITILNKDALDYMEIDLSDVVAIGAEYEIKDVQDILGNTVVSGIYEGEAVRVPLNLAKVSQINGDALVKLKHTPKEFNVFLVRSSGNFISSTSNNSPTLDVISDPEAIDQNATLQTVELSGITAGQGEEQGLTITALSSNTALISHPKVIYSSPDETGNIQYKPVEGKSGTAEITVTVDDGQAENHSFSRTFTVSVNTAEGKPVSPTAPSQLTAKSVSDGSIDLAWRDNANNEKNFVIERAATAQGEFKIITTLGSNMLTFRDAGLAAFTTYYYRLKASNETGTSDYSNIASTTTVKVAPPPSIARIVLKNADYDEGEDIIKELADGDSINVVEFGDPAVYIQAITAPDEIGSVKFELNGGSHNHIETTSPYTMYENNNTWGKSRIPVFGTLKLKVTPYQGSNSTGVAGEAKTMTIHIYRKENLPPTLNAVADPAPIWEDAGEQTLKLMGISAGKGEQQPLLIVALSANKSLLDDPSILYNDQDDTAVLSFKPKANKSGSALITVNIYDGGITNHSISKTFRLVVKPVNDAPTLDALPDIMLANNGIKKEVSLAGITAGAPDEQQIISIQVSSDNPAVLQNPAITYFSPNSAGIIALKAVEGSIGTAKVTVTVKDNGVGTAPHANTLVKTFNVHVGEPQDVAPFFNPVADPAAIFEDAGRQEIKVAGINPGNAKAVVVSAFSENTSLIPDPTVAYDAKSATATLTYSPVHNAFGSTLIKLVIKDKEDETNFTTQALNVKVLPVNDAPSMDLPENIYLVPGQLISQVPLSGIHTGAPDEDQKLSIIAASDNDGLVKQLKLFYTSPQNTGMLDIELWEGKAGSANITLTISDDGPHKNTTIKTFTVTVNSGHAPLVEDINKKVENNKTVNFSSADFEKAFTCPQEKELKKIKVLSLPKAGVLSLSGEKISIGDEIKTEMIRYLTYEAGENFTIADHFQWNATNDVEYAAKNATVNLSSGSEYKFYLVDYYPNPVKDKVTIDFYAHQDIIGEAVVHHLNGMVAKKFPLNINEGGNQFVMETDDLKEGMYIVSISHKFKKIHFKLLKQ